jgi:DNA-binding MarR family transcriptional regulator
MEWLLLGAVGRSDGRQARMSAAAASLGVTLPQVTALASSLLELKLVRQKVTSGDKRGRQLELTGKGMNVLEDTEEAIGAIIEIHE